VRKCNFRGIGFLPKRLLDKTLPEVKKFFVRKLGALLHLGDQRTLSALTVWLFVLGVVCLQ